MAQTSIEWTAGPNGEPGFTFNGWIGCDPVSPACDDCYAARSLVARMFKVKWGVNEERYRTSEQNWALPRRWDRKAKAAGTRYRVFAHSLSDWLDRRVPIEWLADLLDLVRSTPNLDWLLLSKRIGNWRSRVQAARDHVAAREAKPGDTDLLAWLDAWLHQGIAPANAWLGATVVTQAEADRDIRKLLEIPAALHYISVEPMLELMNLRPWLRGVLTKNGKTVRLDWVIVGGESGDHARPLNPKWVRDVRQQCEDAGVRFMFKQWGENRPLAEAEEGQNPPSQVVYIALHDITYAKVGKKNAGRELDGAEHLAVPPMQEA